MNYKNISHNLELLSDEQEYVFSVVALLIDNLNNIKPSNFVNNTVRFENNEFKIQNLGYKHAFLIKDIKNAIIKDLENHKLFIIKEVKQAFKYYKNDKTNTNYVNTKLSLEHLVKYYKNNYPLYLNTDFGDFIKDLDISIQKEFSKL